MYPFGRLVWQMIIASRQPKLSNWDEHTSHHYCMPWDVDMFGEMNNGRVLTFTDLGRFPLALRGGLIKVIWRNKWQLTMAGATPLLAQNLPSDPDVVIIGAGAAGLQAGRTLQHKGISFVIVEAATRVGGRAYTESARLGAPVTEIATLAALAAYDLSAEADAAE